MSEPLFSKLKIKKNKKEIEPQEILLDRLSQKKEKELGISEKKLETPLSQGILRIFWIAVMSWDCWCSKRSPVGSMSGIKSGNKNPSIMSRT